MQAGILQRLAESLLGFRTALEQAVQQALRAEHGIRVAAQVGHGVAEQVAAAGVQFPQHGHELLPEAGFAPCPVLPQLQQRGLLRAGDVAPVAVRRVEAAVAVQGQALRLRRQGRGYLHASEVGHGLAHAALGQLLIAAQTEMVVEARPDLRIQALAAAFCRDAFHPCPDDGLQCTLLVRGDGGFRRLRGRAFGTAVHPVVPQDVVTFGLVELYLCPQLRRYLPGVDAVEVGGQLADRHAEHFPLVAILGNRHDVRDGPSGGCCHDDNTPSALIVLELAELRRPIQTQIFNDGLHGRKRLSLVVDAEDGVTVEGDGRKLAHDGLRVQ